MYFIILNRFVNLFETYIMAPDIDIEHLIVLVSLRHVVWDRSLEEYIQAIHYRRVASDVP